MKQVFKATIVLGGSTVIATCIRIVNVKFIAIFLGPTGVGIFYQLVFYSQLMYLFTSFGTKMGSTKYLSELKAQDDHESIQTIYQTCSLFLISFSLLISFNLFFFADNISNFIFATPQYAHYVRIATLAIPLGALMDFNYGVLCGFRMVKSIASFNIAESILNVAIFLVLVYFFSILGATISIFTSYIIQLSLLIILIKRLSPVKLSLNIFKWVRIKFQSITKIIRYGFVSLIIVFVQNLFLTILFRRLIITHLGIEANGFYAPAYGISLQMYFLLGTAINAYSFSRISETQDKAVISQEINHLTRTLLIIIVPIIFVLVGFRRYAILLLYTDKFLPVTSVMPIQFLGDFFKLLVMAISLPIHARADLKAMLFFETGIYVFFYKIASILIPSMGLMGTGWSYLLIYLVYFIVVTPYVMKKFHVRLEGKNIWIILTSLLLILAGSQLNLSLSGMILASIVLLGGWAGVTLTREEWVFGLKKSKEYLGKAAQFARLR